MNTFTMTKPDAKEVRLAQIRANAAKITENLKARAVKPINDPNGIFLIFNEETKLYWSNTDGWCDNTRSIFSFEEKQTLNLPIGGRWVSLAHDPEHYPELDS